MTSYAPTDIAYQKQLRQIAREVDRYLVNNMGELENFRGRIKPLVQRWNNYQKAIQEKEKAVSEHWELVKKNPKLQDKNAKSFKQRRWEWDRFYLLGLGPCGSNPINEMPAKCAPDVMIAIGKYLERNEKNERGYSENSSEYKRLQEAIVEQRQNLEDIRSEFDKLNSTEKNDAWIKTPPKTMIPNKTYDKFTWWRYLNLPDEMVFGCWRPKLKPVPENPLERLRPTEEDYRSKPKELLTLPRPTDQNEEYERYYIFLSSVHDNCLPEVQQITKDIWPDDLAEAVWHCNNEWFGDKTAFLNSALERVKRLKQPAISGKAGDMTQTTPETHENKSVKEKQEGILEPKPPEFLQKILWLWKYGGKYWKLILVSVLLLFISIIFAFFKFYLFNKISNSLKETPNAPANYKKTSLPSQTKISDPNRNSP